jgi:hypothetical protein
MSTPKVHKKVYLILEFLQRKLETKYDIDVGPFTAQEKKEHPNSNFLVFPTGRGRMDADAFSVHLNRRAGRMSDFELFSSILHEVLHIIYWSVVDCHSSALTQVHSKVMKNHLEEALFDSREQGTYRLERAIAPILYPDFLLDTKENLTNGSANGVILTAVKS